LGKPKHDRYQDYVIRDGRLVGEFEDMYRDWDDPWEQTTREAFATEKAVVLNLIAASGAKRVLELGCGLGHFTARIAALGVDALGVDVSETAVEKARRRHPPPVTFSVGDVLDFDVYRSFDPQVIVMAEITWYILDKLDPLLAFLREEMSGCELIHLLTVYPPGRQQYGREFFVDLPGIMAYFDLNYREWGSIYNAHHDGCGRTYFSAEI